jgi:hypothetical protein
VDTDRGPHVVTGRRVQKLRQRARRAQKAGKTASVLTIRDHPGGPLSVLFVGEPGQPSPAFAYFPQNAKRPPAEAEGREASAPAV